MQIEPEFKNNLAIFELPKNDPRLVERAQHVICGRAKNVDDARLLLDMVGIRETVA